VGPSSPTADAAWERPPAGQRKLADDAGAAFAVCVRRMAFRIPAVSGLRRRRRRLGFALRCALALRTRAPFRPAARSFARVAALIRLRATVVLLLVGLVLRFAGAGRALRTFAFAFVVFFAHGASSPWPC